MHSLHTCTHTVDTQACAQYNNYYVHIQCAHRYLYTWQCQATYMHAHMQVELCKYIHMNSHMHMHSYIYICTWLECCSKQIESGEAFYHTTVYKFDLGTFDDKRLS